MGCLKTAYSWWRHYSKSGMFVLIIVGLALIVVGLALIVVGLALIIVGLALIVIDNDKKCIFFFLSEMGTSNLRVILT